MNPMRALLDRAATQPPLGTWVMSASPLLAEATGHAGYDWSVIDMEHSPLDLATVVQMLQAVAGTRMVPVLRVPWNEPVLIKRVLDAGAQTLLVPFVQNAAEAAAAVAATRYPPQGIRGMAAMSRASRFGTVPQFFQAANETVSVIVQLETPTSIAALEAIAAVPGVDALFVGPGDLSGAMGVPGQPTHPDVMAAMANAARRARALGCHIGTVGGTPEVVQQYHAMGYDFVAVASDLGLFMRAAQAALGALRSGLGGAAPAPAPAAPPQGY